MSPFLRRWLWAGLRHAHFCPIKDQFYLTLHLNTQPLFIHLFLLEHYPPYARLYARYDFRIYRTSKAEEGWQHRRPDRNIASANTFLTPATRWSVWCRRGAPRGRSTYRSGQRGFPFELLRLLSNNAWHSGMEIRPMETICMSAWWKLALNIHWQWDNVIAHPTQHQSRVL